MLTVSGFWLPGTTDPEPLPATAERLAARGLDVDDGGLTLMFDCARRDPDVIYYRTQYLDPRNKIISNCIMRNCWSVIHWRVAHEGGTPWSAYIGVWNEEVAVGVLQMPNHAEPEHLWMSPSPQAFLAAFDLKTF